jgi:geranylgeranyl reductase family protein
VKRDSVIVVGAGPAGATAARTLARAGVTVRLIDRSNFPRNKPCGGGISFRVLHRFPYLESALERIPTHTVARLYLEGPDGDSTVVESDGPAALMIRRVEFDRLLVDLAREAGAEFVGGADIVRAAEGPDGVVLEARDGRRFEAAVVVAADGVHSGVARRLGLSPGWPATAVALDMMEETPREQLRDLDPSTLWVSYGYEHGRLRSGEISDKGSSAAEGYAYIFPKRDHVNVGIGYVLDHYRRRVDVAPYDLQRQFVDHLRRQGVMEGESVRAHFTPSLIPVGGPLARPGRGRVLLAGDAGGFVNGFTAEGIYYAMVSGELAARAIAATPREGPEISTLAARYAKACNREIGAELRDSVLIQRHLFADRRRIARVIAGAQGAPAMTKLILDFAVGRMSYGALRRRMLARAPLLAGHLIWTRLRSRLFSGTAAAATI